MACPDWDKCKNFNCHNEQYCMDIGFWAEYWKNKHKDVPGHVEPVKEAKIKFQDGKCYYCEREFGNRPLVKTRDHIIPLSKGGKNIPLNKVDACERCNSLKADMMPEKFAIHLGVLLQKKCHIASDTLITILFNTRALIKKIHPYRNELFKFQANIPEPEKLNQLY